jgi:hypothetical protein
VATLAAGNCQGTDWNDVLTGSACRSQVTILAVVPDCQITAQPRCTFRSLAACITRSPS